MGPMLGYIGRNIIVVSNHVASLCAFARRLLRLPFDKNRDGRAIVRVIMVEQMYFTGVQSLPILIPTALVVGTAMIIQFAAVSGQYDLGKLILILIVRELGPMVTALILILRSATAVTIEISYMQVLHEIEALEMSGIDPLRIIGLPRLAGITFSVLCLFILFDLFALAGGYLIVLTVTPLPVGNLPSQLANAVTATDIAVGMVKALCFGVTITSVALYHGFRSKQSITQIPVVTSRAAIESFFYCLLANFFISFIFYY
jgi:phospholipid/cholesterol/gamma-HCH transport system permease protein